MINDRKPPSRHNGSLLLSIFLVLGFMSYTCEPRDSGAGEKRDFNAGSDMKVSASQHLPEHSREQGGEKEKRKILYWRSPMNPTEIYDHPGKSKMGMDLVPVYEDQMTGGGEVRIDPVIQQDMGVRTAFVEKGALVRNIRTYGHVTYNETRTVHVSPKFSGWIEKLYVDFTGQAVRKGDPLFRIYSPELVTAQREYLEARKRLDKFSVETGESLLDAVKQKLLYMDVPEDQLRSLEKSGEITKTLIIRSPFEGIVVEKKAIEGSYVKEGTSIYTISDLSTVWVDAHIFEYELPWVRLGEEVEITLSYLPGKLYRGKVSFIYPYLERKTRDVVLRLQFENPNLELKPNMYANVNIKARVDGQGLIIPSEAVLQSGERNIVFVTRGDGKFAPRNVTLGLPLQEGKVQVLTGLIEGEEIVTSGQFLLDSESTLREAVQKMLDLKKAKAEEGGSKRQ